MERIDSIKSRQWKPESPIPSLLAAYALRTPAHPAKLRLLRCCLRWSGNDQFIVRHSSTGSRFLADMNDFVGFNLMTEGSFERASLSLCLRIMGEQGGVFADIGAHHGLFSSVVSSLADIQVVSFEPNPASFLRLRANIRANARDNVTLVHSPLGRPEIGLLPWRHSGVTSGTTAWSHAAKRDEAPDYWLAAASFRDALAATGLRTPTLVKIDVEGSELSVLQGFDFGHVRPSYFLIEAQPFWPEKHAFLTIRGYRASGENGTPLHGAVTDAFLEGNALFVDVSSER